MKALNSAKRSPWTRRSAFTIVELLVSLALVIFIMSLVSTVFVLATKSFRDLKAVGDLSEQLRSAGQLIRQMLKADHFENSMKLSDTNFWIPQNSSGQIPEPWNSNQERNDTLFTWRQGFLRLDQSNPIETIGEPNYQVKQEGTDLDGIPSGRYDERQDHRLSMSIILSGKSPSDYFTAYFSGARPGNIPQQKYQNFESSESLLKRKSAEAVLFLAKQESGDSPQTALLSDPSNAKNLYTLNFKSWLLRDTFEPSISSNNPKVSYDLANTMNDIAKVSTPVNRRSFQFFQPGNIGASRFGLSDSHPDTNSIILRNVVSFQVNLLGPDGQPISLGKDGFFDTSAQVNFNQSTYLTNTGSWVGAKLDERKNPPFSNPARANGIRSDLDAVRITGVQIIIRVYDPDNEITRQVTITEAL